MSVFFPTDAGGQVKLICFLFPAPLLSPLLIFLIVLWKGGQSDELRPGKAVRVQRSWLFSGECVTTNGHTCARVLMLCVRADSCV